MSHTSNEKQPTRIARIRGKLVPYAACSEKRGDYMEYVHLFYIGKGTIESINGVQQTSGKTYHFWKEICLLTATFWFCVWVAVIIGGLLLFGRAMGAW